MPIPFAKPGANKIFVEMWFHTGTSSRTKKCLSEPKGEGQPMIFQNLDRKLVESKHIEFRSEMIDPKGSVR